jgi:hypothetical protein
MTTLFICDGQAVFGTIRITNYCLARSGSGTQILPYLLTSLLLSQVLSAQCSTFNVQRQLLDNNPTYSTESSGNSPHL